MSSRQGRPEIDLAICRDDPKQILSTSPATGRQRAGGSSTGMPVLEVLSHLHLPTAEPAVSRPRLAVRDRRRPHAVRDVVIRARMPSSASEATSDSMAAWISRSAWRSRKSEPPLFERQSGRRTRGSLFADHRPFGVRTSRSAAHYRSEAKPDLQKTASSGLSAPDREFARGCVPACRCPVPSNPAPDSSVPPDSAARRHSTGHGPGGSRPKGGEEGRRRARTLQRGAAARETTANPIRRASLSRCGDGGRPFGAGVPPSSRAGYTVHAHWNCAREQRGHPNCVRAPRPGARAT